MALCPAVCTTTIEVVLNFYGVGALVAIIVAGILLFIKKIKPWHFALIVIVSLVLAFLVSVKVNTCDSGCKQNGTIEFENELFGEPSADKVN